VNFNDNNTKSFSAILSESWHIYFKSLGFVVVLVLLTFVPVFVFRMFLPEHYYLAYQDFVYAMQSFLNGQIEASQLALSVTDGAFIYAALHFGIALVFFPLLVAGAVYLVATRLEDQAPSFDTMFSLVFPKFPKMIITTALVVAILFFLSSLLIGFWSGLLLIIPIYLGITYTFFLQVTADTGHWGLRALSISRFLVRRRWFKTFLPCLIMGVLYLGASAALEVVLTTATTSFSLDPLFTMPIFILGHILLAIFPIIFALWYFDIKQARQASLKQLEKVLFDTLNEAMERVKSQRSWPPKKPHEGQSSHEDSENATQKNDKPPDDTKNT